MLNALFRRATRLARAPVFHLAATGLFAWSLWVPATHAAEPPVRAQAMPAPFNHYQGWRDEPLQDWRQANERVGEVGGWRTYLRESQPAGDGADPARPKGDGHDGHHGH